MISTSAGIQNARLAANHCVITLPVYEGHYTAAHALGRCTGIAGCEQDRAWLKSARVSQRHR